MDEIWNKTPWEGEKARRPSESNSVECEDWFRQTLPQTQVAGGEWLRKSGDRLDWLSDWSIDCSID